ncbi:CPBP family intramembrane glutamic endopeptidase [Enterococcus faecalis]
MNKIMRLTRITKKVASLTVLFIVSQLPLLMLEIISERTKQTQSLLEWSLIPVVCLLVCLYFLGSLKRRRLISWNLRDIYSFSHWIILACFLCWISTAIGSLFMNFEGIAITTNQKALDTLFMQVPKGLFWLVAGFTAPISEEYIFRAGIQSLFSKKYQTLGLLVSAIIFGLSHIPTTIGSAVIYIGMGLSFGWLYKKTNRIETPIIAHMLWNTLGILFI